MAQPFDRSTNVPPMGEVDREAGQFWVGNPWQIVSERHNLSAFERNRTFLNLGGRFADLSFLTATDNDGDGRATFAADLDNNGMQDLIVRQAGGGPLLLFINRLPQQHYLRVSLRGTTSNGLGVGARLTAELGSRKIVREMYPINSYFSQAPCEVHFGLGEETKIDRLVIRWPSGAEQILQNVPADQHLTITEGDSVPVASHPRSGPVRSLAELPDSSSPSSK